MPVDLHIGYARYQFAKSKYDDQINDYLALFLKSERDGSERDDTVLNATICVDISGSMGGGLEVSKKNMAKKEKNMTRLQLSIEAIKMFYSKLRPNDSLGLIIFDNQAEVILKQTLKSKIDQEIFFATLNELKPRGGTTISKGFELARDTL